jgi:hypothetical protein
MRFSPDTKRKIHRALALHRAGHHLNVIAADLGCSNSYVRRLLKLPAYGDIGQEACVETCAPVPVANYGPSNCVCRELRCTYKGLT